MVGLPTWFQVAIVLFEVVWLVAVLALLVVIAFNSARQTSRVQRALLDMIERAQHNTQIASEAAREAAHVVALVHATPAKDDAADAQPH